MSKTVELESDLSESETKGERYLIEVFCLLFRNAFYNVFFDLMVVVPQLNSPHSTHREVRRLSNTDSTTGNPFFATKWKIYWWNNHRWEEYNKVTVSSS